MDGERLGPLKCFVPLIEVVGWYIGIVALATINILRPLALEINSIVIVWALSILLID